MKKFKFNYSTPLFILLFFAVLLTLAGIVFNVNNIIEYRKFSLVKTIIYSITLAVNLGLFILIVSIVFNGCYKIKNNVLYACFGLIRTKMPIDSIISITLYKKTQKLVVFFSSAEFSVIIISPKFYDQFIATLKEINPTIIYEQNSIDGEQIKR